jgi:hypothetical protein
MNAAAEITDPEDPARGPCGTTKRLVGEYVEELPHGRRPAPSLEPVRCCCSSRAIVSALIE